MLAFEEKRKSENPEKNVSEQMREPAKTNSTQKWHLRRDRTPHWTPQFSLKMTFIFLVIILK